MKINQKINSCFETLLLALFMAIFSVIAVKAENNFNFDVLNGLFTPTQSERFFQKGREDFKQEVDLLNHPQKYFSDDLLYIDPELRKQLDMPRQLPQLKLENSQYQIYRQDDLQ